MTHEYLGRIEATAHKGDGRRFVPHGVKAERLHARPPAQARHEVITLPEGQPHAGVVLNLHEDIINLTWPN